MGPRLWVVSVNSSGLMGEELPDAFDKGSMSGAPRLSPAAP
jgi:hypothetical protein